MPEIDRIGTPRNRNRFRIGPRSPCLAICESVSSVTGKDLLDLDPLEDSVDTDALGQLVEQTSEISVTFEWEDLDVHVTGSGDIVVTEW